MNIKISLPIFLALFCFQIIYSQIKKTIEPDSIVYVIKESVTTITTLKDLEYKKKKTDENENPPAPPAKFVLDSSVQIQMTIRDSLYESVKYFSFNLKKGTYQINLWAFYENLSPGEYTCVIEYPGKMIRQKFLKIQ